MSFLNANMHAFDDAEENKLEYTAIYETYVAILDKLIDAKLIE